MSPGELVRRAIGFVCVAFMCGSAMAAAAQRIGIKTDAETQKKIFYNRTTGAEFIPRGYNYTVLESRGTTDDCKNKHVTFDYNKYNAYEAGRFLDEMVGAGYNTVRVMIDPGDACRRAVGQWSVTKQTTD